MCALLNDEGEVFVWGYGILGKGPYLRSETWPQQIPSTLFGQSEFNPDVTVVDIQAGIHHFSAITNNGDMYTWGKNTRACLGIGTEKDQPFPLMMHVPAQ